MTSPFLTKRALAKQMLAEGATPYAVNKACKKQFGSGMAYYDLVALREGLPKSSSPVIPVEIPPEILEESPSPPEPENIELAGDLEDRDSQEFRQRLRSIRSWMVTHRIEEVIVPSSGPVSILAWSELDLGGDSDG